MFGKLWRLAKIVWEHGGVLKFWAVVTGVATFSSEIDEWTGFTVRRLLPDWFPNTAWWWGLVVLALWVIYSLANRVLRYETPGLEIEAVQSNIDNSWWLEVRNVGSKPLTNCAVDFERIENELGQRVFPMSFGLVRPDGLSNPFPLRVGQPKQGQFAAIKNGKIHFYGVTVGRQPTDVELTEEKYIFTVAAYSEAEGAHCRKTFILLRDNNGLRVSGAKARRGGPT